MASATSSAPPGSETYTEHNMLDRLSRESTLEFHYRHMMARERTILARRLPIAQGHILSVGCGWHPGRHLFPGPAFHLVAADADPDKVAGVAASGSAAASSKQGASEPLKAM
jgi:hypothetical protein